MSGLSPQARQVLDIIAAGESHDYSSVYGGKKFQGFEDHPRVNVPLANGQHTSAAGRYQLLAPTWDEEARRLGLKDFSPASQDFAAWDLAQRTYQQHTGRGLEIDQKTGQTDWSALSTQWPSLGRFGAGLQARSAPSVLMAPSLVAMQAPGQAPGQAPVQNQLAPRGSGPRPQAPLAALQALAPSHSFEPVDYDPWRMSPMLQPVDHDPFAQETPQ